MSGVPLAAVPPAPPLVAAGPGEADGPAPEGEGRQVIKQTDAVLKSWLDQAIDTGGAYDPATLFMGVYTGLADHGAATVLADVTQATGQMATRKAVTPWGVPYKEADGRWVVDAPALFFTPADSTEAQTLAGFFIASLITAGVLKCWAPFGVAIPMADENAQVTIVFRLTIDPLGRFSAEVVWNGA